MSILPESEKQYSKKMQGRRLSLESSRLAASVVEIEKEEVESLDKSFRPCFLPILLRRPNSRNQRRNRSPRNLQMPLLPKRWPHLRLLACHEDWQLTSPRRWT